VLHRVSEKDLGMLSSPAYDNTVWTLSESAHAQTVPPETSDHAILVAKTTGHGMQHSGETFTYRGVDLSHYERHGAVVLVFTRHGHDRWTGFPPDDQGETYTPNNVELMKDVRLIRGGIVSSLK
jgi:hypothetical protein